MRQLWNLGIRDKKLLSIIRAMLKAPVKHRDGRLETPQKGTPQGGILSPLFANVVLNTLVDKLAAGKRLRETSRLKPMFIVRYADDFKIFSRNARDADKIFHAVRKWLKEQLHLEINPEKSRVVNLHNRYSEFPGLKLKVQKKSCSGQEHQRGVQENAEHETIIRWRQWYQMAKRATGKEPAEETKRG